MSISLLRGLAVCMFNLKVNEMKLTQLVVASVFAASVMPLASMAADPETGSNTGTITFLGSVVNTPCNIQQESLEQKVEFGQLSRKALESGEQAEKDFQIKFTGCDFNNFSKTDTGEAAAVKTMKIMFTGQNYAGDANAFLATSRNNANNLGISIDGFKFGEETDVLSKITNKVGDNTLTFTALAEAIDKSKAVGEGNFSAISNFRITYE